MSELSSFVRTRHRVSGVIDEATPRHIAEHEILGKDLEIVGPNAKPYLPEMLRTTLPADATEDQKAAAEAAGFDVSEIILPEKSEEMRSTINAERAKADAAPTKNGKD